MNESATSRIVSFGVFELDLAARQLRKNGTRIKLQDQPFRVLQLLTERPGEVVTREELKEKLWSDDTFVEFDHSLNTAIQKIRTALADSASTPRFVETIPRQGYRFVAPVEALSPRGVPEPERGRRSLVMLGLTIAILLVATLAAWRMNRDTTPNRITIQAEPLTSLRGAEFGAVISPDGDSIAFARKAQDREDFDVFVQWIGHGEPISLSTDPRPDFSPTWSPDGKRIAFLRALDLGNSSTGVKAEIVVVPSLGGPESSLGSVNVYARELQVKPFTVRLMDWSPSGNRLAIVQRDETRSQSIYSIDFDTRQQRLLAPAGAYMVDNLDPAFSPDGRRLAYGHFDNYVTHIEILDLSEEGLPTGEPFRIESVSGELNGLAWTPAGDVLIASLALDGVYELWNIPVSGVAPTRLAGAGYGAQYPSVARNGHNLIYEQERLDTNIWRMPGPLGDAQTATERIIESTRREQSVQYSRDGSKIAFFSSRTGKHDLWIANADGSGPLQVTTNPGAEGTPRWSPDGQFISFESRAAGSNDIYIVSSAGGNPRRLTTHPASDALSSWSNDGRYVYFASNRNGQYHVWKMPSEGGEATRVTEREGRESHESSDGKYLYFAAPNRIAKGLWRKDLATGEEELVVPEASRGGWAVIEAGVIYLVRDAPEGQVFRFLDFETGRTSTFAVFPKDAQFWGSPMFDVSPDGRWLIYSILDDYESDLMVPRDFDRARE